MKERADDLRSDADLVIGAVLVAGENRDPKAPPGRVRVVIQPKGKDSEAKPAPRGERLELKGSGNLGSPIAQ